MEGQMNSDLLEIVSALPAVTYYPPAPIVSSAATGSSSDHDPALKPWYVSPNYEFDIRAQVLVVQFRNTETGLVTEQIPSEAVLEKYRLFGGPADRSAIADTTA
jgi:hypothetical protein